MSCRKKIDSKMWLDYTQTMETEVRSLKQELSRTREALKAATKRCRDLVRELDSRTVGHESERCLRDQQLSRILRALLVLESRLKQEQKSIRQLLCEKDNVIRNQQLEIAKLRRYTKNYIKCKREQSRNSELDGNNAESASPSVGSFSNLEDVSRLGESLSTCNNRDSPCYEDLNEDGVVDEIGNELGNDIQRLKHEIIDKLSTKNLRAGENDDDDNDDNDENETTRKCQDVRQLGHDRIIGSGCCVRKTDSFAGSDVSKESCASSSENTDAGSILTTTTDESSPSLISTEGFCEGESTDCSPGSTLNKSSSKFANDVASRNVHDPRVQAMTGSNDRTIVNDDAPDRDGHRLDESSTKRRYGVARTQPLDVFFDDRRNTEVTITRTESKDDGLDCNFASDDENLEDMHEPIYVNACNENNARNLRGSITKIDEDDVNADKNGKEYNFDNNNGPSKLDQEETSVEETSGNWYSDPDEDRTSDEVFRQSCYRPNGGGNHNSVLECVNQILLRDMEEEESALTAPRRFKHRGRIVRFQPARLSDIESVGSEMERRNSDDCPHDDAATNETEIGNFEGTASEDEFGMRIDRNGETRSEALHESDTKSDDDDDDDHDEDTGAAIPIVVIEPKAEHRETNPCRRSSWLEVLNQRPRTINGSASPTLRMERIEEKTCLQMSSKGLTIAKNLDYEDIESLPDIVLPQMPKTPPALPPKPTQFRNTLVLKKIPSPSFLIDETRRKRPHQRRIEMETRIPGCLVSSSTKTSSNNQPARSLVFEQERYSKVGEVANDSSRNGFASSRTSSNRATNESSRGSSNVENLSPRVTNIVRHFEEFKIGGEPDDTRKFSSRDHHGRPNERSRASADFDHFDIRQNFEEFNLDECDLSDDPDRPEADGSERLVNVAICQIADNGNSNNNNHLVYASNRATSNVTVNNANNGIYDNFLEATGLSNKSILTPSRLLSNHKSMLKPKDVKYKNRIKSNAVMEKNASQTGSGHLTQVRHWTGPFV